MSLYRMELYKILRRPIVRISGVIFAALLLFFFYAMGDSERSSLSNSEPVFGYPAIQQDRELAKKFEGPLTDEKIQQIVDLYGFPSKKQKGYNGWGDQNFVTGFVTEFFSDGYISNRDYKAAENIIPIKEADIYKYIEGEPLHFGYYRGWEKYIIFMEFAGEILIIWLTIALSPLFSQEIDTGMYSLIFTTKNGSTKDIHARILAAFTVVFVSFLIVAGLSFWGCWQIYGLGGAKTLYGFLSGYWIRPYTKYTILKFTVVYIMMNMTALFMTCGFCVFVSAKAKSNFNALLVTGGFLTAPIVLFWFFRSSVVALCASQPVFLMLSRLLTDVSYKVIYWEYLCINSVLVVVCIFAGVRRWRTGLQTKV